MTATTLKMKHLKSLLSTFLIVLSYLSTQAQWSSYNYERPIEGITEDWHSIKIPDGVFSKVNPSLNDIRIYGISEKNDTLEVPYLLKVNQEKWLTEKRSFEIINTSKKNDGYYYTFKLEDIEPITDIELVFKNSNFDWKTKLEGSTDQQEWFTILDDYRILNIKNESTDYRFTRLVFPAASYRYFRLWIKTDSQPELETAYISELTRSEGTLVNHAVKSIKTTQNKTRKTTEIIFKLDQPVPVSSLKINVESDFDYFRSVNLSYLADSLKTEKGWKYNYQTFKKGTLNSLEDNEFNFKSIIAQNFKFVINNNDNQPLEITTVEVQGFQHELIARFSEPANYKMVYGNKNASSPNYDISKFKENIPKELTALEIGAEQSIAKPEQAGISALFENEIWLWGIMGVIILILGGFTFKMLKNSESKIVE